MIVCSCNVLSDHDVRHAVNATDDLPRNVRQVYGCLGCSVECGRCASTVKTIIDGSSEPAPRPAIPDARTAARIRSRMPAPSSRSLLPEALNIERFRRRFSAMSCSRRYCELVAC
jgi:bacterioferritin-associated ferredoxin